MFPRKALLGIVSIALTAVSSPGYGKSAGEEGSGSPVAREARTRLFEFTYKATISELPEETRRLEIWLPYPTTDPNQEILDMEIDSPAAAIVYTEPRFGNSILHVSVDNPRSGPVELQMRFKVRRVESVSSNLNRTRRTGKALLDPEIARYLKPDALVPLTSEVIRWAMEVTRGRKTDVEKARAIYDYTVATMKYDKNGAGWGRGDLIYACDEKRGNCTDFHAVFIGFSRAVTIPTRFAIGFPLPEKRGEGEIDGYHCWAEFYLPGYGWVPVDASEAWKNPEKKNYYFGSHDENRVQFSIGRDITLRPPQQAGPLNYFIYPYAEADGTPINRIKREFRFRDLDNPAPGGAAHDRPQRSH